jgi:hypothetical protein
MTNVAQANTTTGMSTNDAVTHDAETFQLTRLSSVLNGLENGATAMRRHAQEAMRAVQSGTYAVDPKQLSQRIVGEALGPA